MKAAITFFLSVIFFAVWAQGGVGINTNNPVHTLDVVPKIAGNDAAIGIYGPVQPKIEFGDSGDVNLYRSGSNKLSTDDTLVVMGALGVNNASPSPSAALDISSTNKGVLFPRMSTANRNAIISPQPGLIIFNTTTNCLEFYVGGSWQPVACGCTTPPAAPVGINGTSSGLCISTPYSYSIGSVSGASSYVWSVNGTGASITGGQGTAAATITFANNSPTTVSVAAVNSCGTGAAALLPISFTSTPATPGSITASTTTVCPNQTGITFSITPVANALSYNWNLPSGASITAGAGTNAITVTWGTIAGSITVSANGCNGLTSALSAATSITMPVPTAPGTPTTGISSACPGQTGIALSATAPATPGPGGVTSYTWSLPVGCTVTSPGGVTVNGSGITSPTTNSITVTWTNTIATGNISVLATNCNGNSTSSGTLSITMPVPTVPGTPAASTTTPCPGQTGVTLAATAPATPGPGGVTSYTWSLPVGTTVTNPGGVTVNGSGVTSPTTNNITVTWANTVASGSVSVIASNCNGNSSSSGALGITMPVPGAPTASAATSLNTTTFNANWSSPGGTPAVSSYRLDVSTSPTFASGMVLNDFNVGNVTTYNVTGLTCNTTYYYRVRAVNCNGAGANSSTITVVMYCRSCNGIKTAYPSAVDGTYTIDPDGSGAVAPLSCFCDMTTNGGGWTQLNSSLTGISVGSATASWSGSSVVGKGLGGGCGGVTQYTLTTPLVQFTSVYMLMTRTTSIFQCSSITGGSSSGYYSGTYNGSFTSAGTCNWADGFWANGCCTPTNMSGLQLNWVFNSTASNTALTWNMACSDPSDNGNYVMRWFVK